MGLGVPAVAPWVKDPVLPQLWRRLTLRDFHVLHVWQKKEMWEWSTVPGVSEKTHKRWAEMKTRNLVLRRVQVTALRAFASRVGGRGQPAGRAAGPDGGETECACADSPDDLQEQLQAWPLVPVCTLVLCPGGTNDPSQRLFCPHCQHSQNTSLQLMSHGILMT